MKIAVGLLMCLLTGYLMGYFTADRPPDHVEIYAQPSDDSLQHWWLCGFARAPSGAEGPESCHTLGNTPIYLQGRVKRP